MVNIDGLTTEKANEATKNIDQLNSYEIVKLINQEDQKVAPAVEKELPQVAKAVEAIEERYKNGGRIIYCGAGTSGRMGTLDSVELTPTYNVPPERAFGLLAGGEKAMYASVEGAEDSKELAVEDLKNVNACSGDCIIGIAASGRTPYTISALKYAKSIGALSISITCNKNSEMARIADISIAPVLGPEVISGSTRMKAGTAQKLIVNMISTAVMVRLGKVYQNYMTHLLPTNEKLVERATRMIADITGTEHEEALQTLKKSGMAVPEAIIMQIKGCSREEAARALEQADGRVRDALGLV